MEIEVIVEDARWEALGLEALATRAVAATLARLGLSDLPAEIALLACDDARIAELNGDFRDKPLPTNVLSWPFEAQAARADGAAPALPVDPALGDIAIAYDTCAREATEQGKSLVDHVTHLMVHATLHLLGYDHMRKRDAELMESLEVDTLARLGIADPY